MALWDVRYGDEVWCYAILHIAPQAFEHVRYKQCTNLGPRMLDQKVYDFCSPAAQHPWPRAQSQCTCRARLCTFCAHCVENCAL
eukprot:3065379-Rhodomonas_salina.1